MSESQKREAKRFVEILEDMGYLSFIYDENGIGTLSIIIRDANLVKNKSKALCIGKLQYLLEEVIATYQGEEIKAIMKKARK